MEAKGKFERNIGLLREWTKDEPQNPAAWGFLGRDPFVSGRIEESVGILLRAESLAARDRSYARTPEVRAVLCEALVRLERFDEAEAVAQRAVSESPEHPSGWYWRSHISLMQAHKRLREAIDFSRRARSAAPKYRGLVSFNPDLASFSALLTEADALKTSGDWLGALRLYEHLLGQRPGHVGLRNQVASMVEMAKNVTKAQQHTK